MLLAGLRRGEVTALTWFDIDFKNKIVNVNKSYDFKKCETKQTKTKAGMRKIPMNDYLYNFLLDDKKALSLPAQFFSLFLYLLL